MPQSLLGSIHVGAGPAEKLLPVQLAALAIKAGVQSVAATASADALQMSRAPLSYFAQQSLIAAGQTVRDFADAEEIAEQALQMDGVNKLAIGAEGSPAYNRPNSFPNLLSNLANKILDEPLEMSDATYEQWTAAIPSELPDFKAAPIINKSRHDELDEVLDGDASKQFALREELLGFLQIGRYSNYCSLTPTLVANDDLGAFLEDLLGLKEASENTTNRLCLRQLVGNPVLLDGVALFDDAMHGNLITVGGAGPSVVSWGAMKTKMAAQRDVGGVGRLRSPLRIALVPPAWEDAAIQTFDPFVSLGERKVATTDANINVYRGKVKVVVEPELQDYSATIWYGLADSSRMATAAVVRAYFRGWGRRGRRQRWYDPMTKCLNVELETRVGAAAKQYRTVVRNPGA